eukprot:gene7790-7856_t
MMLDPLDHAILAIVQRDNLVTHEALGAQVGLSASSCRRRLAALRKTGVIVADIAVVDPARIGLAITVHTLITLDRDAAEAHRTFRAIVAAAPEIVACHYVTGPADYLHFTGQTGRDHGGNALRETGQHAKPDLIGQKCGRAHPARPKMRQPIL